MPFLLLLTGCRGHAPLDGAYDVVNAVYGDSTFLKERIPEQSTIRIFKDGYWIQASFGSTEKPFSDCTGGRILEKGEEYKVGLSFTSIDTMHWWKEVDFSYDHKGDKYFLDGKMVKSPTLTIQFKEEVDRLTAGAPLKDTSMEGVWKRQWVNPEFKGDTNFTQIKIYCYPRFAWAQFDEATKKLIGAGGGTYQYDGNILTEHIEYITYDVRVGTDIRLVIKKHSPDRFFQIGADGINGEDWKRLP